MQTKLTFGSLFSGIGGADLGLERAGMKCLWQSEFDPTSNLPVNQQYNNRVLAKHWPEVRRYGDIKKIHGNNTCTGCEYCLDPVELIVGGFPCQPHSFAGKRKGEEDDRNLWPEFLRLIKEIRPRWVVGENVQGIVSLYLDKVLFDLEIEGYTSQVYNIPALAFGAPHRRARIFIIAHSNRQRQRDSLERQAKIRQLNGGNKQMAGRGTIQTLADSQGWHEFNALTPGIKKETEGGTGNLSEIGDRNLLPGNEGQNGQGKPITGRASWWGSEPRVDRVAYGIPDRAHRLKGLGNAIVPQVMEFIGRVIMEVENDRWI